MDPSMIMAMMQMAQQMQGNAAQTGQAVGSGGDWAGSLAQSPLMGALGPMAIPATIGLGYLSGKKAKKKKKKLQKKLERSRQTTASIFGKAMSQQEALSRQATKQRLAGFDTAQKAAQLQASRAKRDVLSRGQQQQASLAQGLTDRGLGSTTVGANLGRGIQSDINRGTSGIDEALGNYFGQLAMGRAGVEAGGTDALAGLAGERAGFDIQNAQYWDPYNWQRFGAANTKLGGMQQPQMQQFNPAMLSAIFGGGSGFGAKGGTGGGFNSPQTANLMNLAGMFGA